MATLPSPDANIFEEDALNWRFVVYPVLAALVLVFGGCGIYFYQQNQRAENEAAARQALLAATSPEALVQVADKYPNTTHAAIALLAAGNQCFEQGDFTGAQKDFQRVTATTGVDAQLRDTAQLGYASSLESSGQTGQPAVQAYLVVAHRGKDSPYAPYAYAAAARLAEQHHDTDTARQVLTEAIGLGGDSQFTKDAQNQLQALDVSAPATGAGPALTP